MRYGNDRGSSLMPILSGLLVLALLIGGGYYLYKRLAATSSEEPKVDYPALPTVTFTPQPTAVPTPTPTPVVTPTATPKATPGQVAGVSSSNLPKSGPETDIPTLATIATSALGLGYYVQLKKRVRNAYRNQAVDTRRS